MPASADGFFGKTWYKLYVLTTPYHTYMQWVNGIWVYVLTTPYHTYAMGKWYMGICINYSIPHICNG